MRAHQQSSRGRPVNGFLGPAVEARPDPTWYHTVVKKPSRNDPCQSDGLNRLWITTRLKFAGGGPARVAEKFVGS